MKQYLFVFLVVTFNICNLQAGLIELGTGPPSKERDELADAWRVYVKRCKMQEAEATCKKKKIKAARKQAEKERKQRERDLKKAAAEKSVLRK